MKQIRRYILILLLLSALLAGCVQEPQVREITLIAEDIHWSQTVIEAKVGETLEITIRNDGALDHDFVVEELDIHILLSPGQQTTVTIEATEPGIIDFICNIPGHLDAGMEGQIVISE
jgi:nitrite reductase (NO-forming)